MCLEVFEDLVALFFDYLLLTEHLYFCTKYAPNIVKVIIKFEAWVAKIRSKSGRFSILNRWLKLLIPLSWLIVSNRATSFLDCNSQSIAIALKKVRRLGSHEKIQLFLSLSAMWFDYSVFFNL